MAASAFAQSINHISSIRPIRMQDDLMDVANLVEMCFSGFLDEDGMRFIQNMKQAAIRLQRNPNEPISRFNIPTNGFIWQEFGRTIACLNTIPIKVLNRPAYLIANVAVHPDYRRRGIGRELTAKALQQARDKGAKSAWLQVRMENQGAVDLYRQLGFVSRSIRTTWHAKPGLSSGNFQLPRMIRISSRRLSDWDRQQYWLDKVYPEYLRWHLPFKMGRMQPGMISTIKRYFYDVQVQHWSLRMNDEIIGALSWQTSSSQADHLWLAAPLSDPSTAIECLLPYVLRIRKKNRTLAINFPTNIGKEAFEQAGFEEHINLIWMECLLN